MSDARDPANSPFEEIRRPFPRRDPAALRRRALLVISGGFKFEKHNRAFLLVFTILFGMVSTFGTVSFATETPVDPSTNTQQVIGRTPVSEPPAADPTTPVTDPTTPTGDPTVPTGDPTAPVVEPTPDPTAPSSETPTTPTEPSTPEPATPPVTEPPATAPSSEPPAQQTQSSENTGTQQPSQTPSTTNQNRPTTSREAPEEAEESSSEVSSEPEESSSSVSLPSVSVPDDSSLLPSSSMAPTSNRTLNWIGIIAWVCIGLGVIVVVIVILSNRSRRAAEAGASVTAGRNAVKSIY